MKACYLQR